ncbi:hydroxymethylbilane synthase [Halorubrum ezzemoulense]|uniref:Hydroxymethylbilane synthase n=3 Tax=Halorubrum ezzemoulense TaxID=337243 RepID=A0A256IY33_HALEZ|nr:MULTISPECIES: hydroxymethylbilane synthase [Halorubrum]MDB2237988.1 hydroxymethylbilane synthase [Halorubrum ezzemoulense]MDB2240418.1 hydroxymethylbilane synthase [Halorubrum ezzemoulense]MDB2247457.1 hydroxymethylbilane synthase [Halorubrum ezzemoulense]MDB2261723.1 hydroxymethylbilane synthase [Halorubrum ezzemoulense]MDB2264100.1 hydroxymethylbilane synthase [Halorubrum ezzemoulense]
MTETLRLATRGSDLALRQAETVREALSSRRRDVELRQVETRGDQIPDELIHRLGKTGAFVRALDEEVLAGDADLAVHSLKDLPTEEMAELVVAGVPERAPSGDVVVQPEGLGIEDLPAGAVVGTGSLRRGAQIRAARPDLTVEPIRGNVDTRLEKLLAPGLQAEHERRLIASGEENALTAEADEGGDENADDTDDEDTDGDEVDEEFDETVEEWFDSLSDLERDAMERKVETEYDAVVLAEAGLRRSNLFYEVETTRLPREEYVPAAGQGAIAVTASDPDVIEAVRKAVDHPRTRVAVTVERTILGELNGGCVAPIGVSAMVQGEHVHVRARVLSTDGTEEVADTRDLPIRSHATAAAEFAADLADRGADELIAEAREEADADE